MRKSFVRFFLCSDMTRKRCRRWRCWMSHSLRPDWIKCICRHCRQLYFYQAEVEDIIWEVDDDSDKCVSWAEFQAMYHRCRVDRTGTLLFVQISLRFHLCAIYNILTIYQVMNRDAYSTSLSLWWMIEMAVALYLWKRRCKYLRFGKGLLDTVIFKIVESLPLHHLILLCFAQQLEEIFGTSDTNSTKDLSLTEFLQSVTTSHVKQLRSKLASWCACPGIGHISKYIACNIMITSRHTWLLQGMTVCLWYILWDGSLPGKVLARAEILKMIKY